MLRAPKCSSSSPWSFTMNSMQVASACLAVLIVVLFCPEPGTLVLAADPPEKYSSADEAFGIGAVNYNAGKYAAAEEPFEAAIRLTDDVKRKVRIYRALMASYRLHPDIDEALPAVEYIIANSDQPAEKSIVRTEFMSFVHQRGKTDDVVKRYEDKLKADPNDSTALYLLSEVYVRLKQDPKRGAELLERMAAQDKKSNKPVNVAQQAELARQYVQAKKFKEGAELYESVAPQDPKLAAWNWKEAAAAWLKAGDKQKALEAAKKSSASVPEARSDLLTHFWHKGLGDVFLGANEPKLAIPHYEKAIASTTIDGYVKGTQKKLDEARQQAGK